MSLLIKALDKAQNAKTEQAQAEESKVKKEAAKEETKATIESKVETKTKTEALSDLELSLSPTGSSLVEPSIARVTAPSSASVQDATPPITHSNVTSNLSSKNAANVFSAKGIEASNQNTKLALIAGAGLLALLGLGLYYYQFINNTPDVVIPPRPVALQPAPQLQPEVASAEAESVIPQAFEPDESLQLAEENTVKKWSKKQAQAEKMDDEFAGAESEVEVDAPTVSTKPNKKSGKSKKLQFGEAIASESASISVTRTVSQAGVNPTLMSAYEAYNAGNDADAQKLYKQVLQRDVRNVDALLGLGAIASRQGRVADANGWYSKVLEVDPRNNIAQTAFIDSQPQGNEQGAESRLKNMLTKQPGDANLHVALGNLYAEQNQWPAAQQAYFDAYSLNASADNAFNLAVSLDQMGKPKLALPYYQQASELAQTHPSGIDKAALEARIAVIQ